MDAIIERMSWRLTPGVRLLGWTDLDPIEGYTGCGWSCKAPKALAAHSHGEYSGRQIAQLARQLAGVRGPFGCSAFAYRNRAVIDAPIYPAQSNSLDSGHLLSSKSSCATGLYLAD